MSAHIATLVARARRRPRRLFKRKPIRLPGTYPWTKAPPPLPLGTVLIEADPPVVADGKGGVAVGANVLRMPERASRPRTR